MCKTMPIIDDDQKRVNSVKFGILLGSISLFLTNLAASVTFPFLQAQRDALGCDALCYGSMQVDGCYQLYIILSY